MSTAVEFIFVWIPMVASIMFVTWFAYRCRCEGLTLLQTLIDRRFMKVFLYTGALLAIYLSTFHFFYFGLSMYRAPGTGQGAPSSVTWFACRHDLASCAKSGHGCPWRSGTHSKTDPRDSVAKLPCPGEPRHRCPPYWYRRWTASNRPCTSTSEAGTMIGSISMLAGCSLTMVPSR